MSAPKIPQTPSLLLLVLLAAPTASGCGAGAGRSGAPPTAPPTATAGRLGVGGVWDLVRRTIDSEGDEMVERHEWQLHEQAGTLRGVWIRGVSWTSTSGVPFACNGRPAYTAVTRYELRGERRGDAAAVSATPLPQSQASGPQVPRATTQLAAPCAEPAAVRRCQLRWQPEPRVATLLVRCADGAAFAITRRLDQPVPLDLALRPAGSVTGLWTWHHRSIDPEGDVKSETEVWQLRQAGDSVAGFYDRTVFVRSGDGRRFQCNDRLDYTSHARFHVRGAVSGSRIRIRELRFVATPHTCETGHRTLDEYEGALQLGGEVILLSWGRGAQLLYRRY